MTNFRLYLVSMPWLLILVAGCDSKVPKDAVTPDPAPTAAKDATPKGAAPDPDANKDLDRTGLPANLQSDAYHYYGLSSSKPVDVSLQQPGGNESTGSYKHRLIRISGGVATFAEDTTGGIHDANGDGTLELRPDGLYEATSTKAPIKQPFLELPADLSKGKTWTSKSTVQGETGDVSMNLKSESLGEVPLTIGKKSIMALCVSQTGVIGQEPVRIKNWYLKDVGLVKYELATVPKKGPVSKIVLEWQPGS